jgi:catechol 2,3-dioxygenase-like lactoylglutathione lyase family enzyme
LSTFARVVPRLPVSDLQGSVDWYVNTLDFTLDSTFPDDEPTFAILRRDAVLLQLYVSETLMDTDLGNATLSIDVTDATGLHRTIAEKTRIDWGPEVYWYGRREFAVTDPNGYMIILSEETDDPVTDDDRGESADQPGGSEPLTSG